MKTKILLLAALGALIVNSCTADRENEDVQPPVSQKIDLENLKTNNNKGETSKVSDSIDLPDHQFSSPPNTGLDPNPDPNPTEPNDPGTQPIVDPTKPVKPW